VGGEERRHLSRRPRAADPRGGGEGHVTLLLGPDPEGSDDGRDLRASARVPHSPGVDHLAEVLGRDLERLPVGEEEAHPREVRLVVADCRLRRAVLVPEPAQVAADELAERRLAVRLVLHRLPDDPGRLAERQARVAVVRATRLVDPDELTPHALLRRSGLLAEELELALVLGLGPRVLGSCRHRRRLPDGPRPELASSSPRTRPFSRGALPVRSHVHAVAAVVRGEGPANHGSHPPTTAPGGRSMSGG